MSDADLAVEALLREKLSVARPGDTVLGEEQGEISGTGGAAGGRRWILDPIDGTKNYVRGVPVWATLMALEIDGVIAVGVVWLPRSDGGGGPAAAAARTPTGGVSR